MSIDSPPRLSVGTLLFIAQRAFEEEIVAALHELGFDFTLAQGRLAARIAEGGSRLTDLANAAGVAKQSAAYLLKQIEASGLVTRHADPDDARAQLIVLTDRGRAAQKAARQVEQAIEERWGKLLGSSELEALRTSLEGLRPYIDRHRDADEGISTTAS